MKKYEAKNILGYEIIKINNKIQYIRSGDIVELSDSDLKQSKIQILLANSQLVETNRKVQTKAEVKPNSTIVEEEKPKSGTTAAKKYEAKEKK